MFKSYKNIKDWNKLNINCKNTIILLVIYFIISIMTSLIYPLTENINYLNQFKEGFLFCVFIGPIYMFINNFKFGFDLKSTLFFIILLSGNIFPFIGTYKNRKLFPYIVISAIFFCIYLFFGLILFGIRNGEWENF
jgi:hypothetical protein